MDGFTEVMHKFYPTNFEVVKKIRQQLPMYQFQEGDLVGNSPKHMLRNLII